MPDLTPAERAVVDALIGYTEVDPDDVDDVDRAEILRLARLVLAAARPHIAAETLRDLAHDMFGDIDSDPLIESWHRVLLDRADHLAAEEPSP